MFKWDRFFEDIQQDIKLFIYIFGLFCFFRIGFILILKSNLSPQTNIGEILFALACGAQLSLKSTWPIIAGTFVCCTLLNQLSPSRWQNKVRLWAGFVYITVLTLLFYTRLPYYKQFHSAFNQYIYGLSYEDWHPIWNVMVKQYNFFGNLTGAIITTFVLCWILKKWMDFRTFPNPKFLRRQQKWAFRLVVLISLAGFSSIVGYGSNQNSSMEWNWDTSALSKDEFLNEAILDDIQALRRASSQHDRLKEATGLDIRTDSMVHYCKLLSGKPDNFNNLDDYFRKSAHGARIEKPKHIFLIIGESYASWPLQDKYKNLNLANGMRAIIAKDNAVYTSAFVPAGNHTIPAIIGIITGLADTNLWPTYQEESYKGPYSTALAPQMKKLGYKTFFWYAGFSTWERIRDFTLAQGFDEFRGIEGFENVPSNHWGGDDKKMFQKIADEFNGNESNFYVIMTVSNHIPFSIDLAAENFDEAGLVNALPDNSKSDKDLVRSLGHFWYSDQCVSNFIKTMYQKYPDSLFIFTGDHGDRENLKNYPGIFERFAVPLVFYGKGISKTILPQNWVGGHLNIAPTLIELIAPRGFEYYSFVDSLTEGSSFGFGQELWVTHDYIYKFETKQLEALPWNSGSVKQPDVNQLNERLNAILAVSWWRVKEGIYLR